MIKYEVSGIKKEESLSALDINLDKNIILINIPFKDVSVLIDGKLIKSIYTKEKRYLSKVINEILNSEFNEKVYIITSPYNFGILTIREDFREERIFLPIKILPIYSMLKKEIKLMNGLLEKSCSAEL